MTTEKPMNIELSEPAAIEMREPKHVGSTWRDKTRQSSLVVVETHFTPRVNKEEPGLIKKLAVISNWAVVCMILLFHYAMICLKAFQFRNWGSHNACNDLITAFQSDPERANAFLSDWLVSFVHYTALIIGGLSILRIFSYGICSIYFEKFASFYHVGRQALIVSQINAFVPKFIGLNHGTACEGVLISSAGLPVLDFSYVIDKYIPFIAAGYLAVMGAYLILESKRGVITTPKKIVMYVLLAILALTAVVFFIITTFVTLVYAFSSHNKALMLSSFGAACVGIGSLFFVGNELRRRIQALADMPVVIEEHRHFIFQEEKEDKY